MDFSLSVVKMFISMGCSISLSVWLTFVVLMELPDMLEVYLFSSTGGLVLLENRISKAIARHT